jgi:hypothetical protein
MAVSATTMALIQAAVTVGSIVYQNRKTGKLRDAQKRAEELRKGFEVVVDGMTTAAPIVYGRALVGGNRVYHNVSNNFTYTIPNSDKQFINNDPDISQIPYTTWRYNALPGATPPYYTLQNKQTNQILGGTLTRNLTGTKNEFLYFQQVLCQGPISGVYDCIINESIDLDDPMLGNNDDTGISAAITPKSAFRIDVHNGLIARADSIISANVPSRVSAKFPGVAYASCVFKINRDDPTFSAVPNVQFIIEGRLIHKILSNFTLSPTRVYSTNPIECLLDYLTDTTCGRGVPISKIDLKSFKEAADICDREVMSNAKIGGKIWKPTDNSRNVSSRPIPLYECNIIIDVQRPIRENVAKILATAPGAKLVWSQNRYKVLLQAPQTNSEILIAGTLTDDDIILDNTIELSQPGADSRLNYATIRFNNEAMDFKEDSVSWPPKLSGRTFRGVNADVYPTRSGWEDGNETNQFLNSYAVWKGSGATCTLVWKFVVKNTGVHTFKYACDDNASFVLTAPSGASSSGSVSYPQTAQVNFTGTKDDIYTLSVSCTNTGGLKGFAGTIIDASNTLTWTSRSAAFTDFIEVNNSNAVYLQFLEEDNNELLESDSFEDGIVDYYHALAMAEQIVRFSRTAARLKFRHFIRNKFYEPGDVVYVNSLTLGITNIPFQVEEARILENGIAELDCYRIDATQYAWNVADDQYAAPVLAYSFKIDAPEFVNFVSNNSFLNNSAGRVTWSKVSDNRTIGYKIYVSNSDELDNRGVPIFREVGTSVENSFELPELAFRTGFVAVRAMTTTGMSNFAISAPVIFNTRSLKLSANSNGFIKNASQVFTPNQIVLLADVAGYNNPVFSWYLNGDLVPGESLSSLTVEPFDTGLINNYLVTVEEAEFPGAQSQLSEQLFLFSIEEGRGTVDLMLSNAAHVFPASSSGVISDYSGALTTIKVMRGVEDATEEFTISRISSSGTISALNGNTQEDYVVPVGTQNVSLNITAVNSATDSGYVDITAQSPSITVTRRFSFSKSKAGVSGTVGMSSTVLRIFRASSTSPATPSSSQYLFSTNSLTNIPAGWSRDMPTMTTNPIWSSEAPVSTADPVTPVTATWSLPVKIAEPPAIPTRYAVMRLYRWSATAPTTFPSGNVTYTWATAQFTNPSALNSWTKTPGAPAAGQTLYFIEQVLIDNTLDAATTVAWTSNTNQIMSTAGVNGLNAPLIRLNPTGQSFKFDKNNVAEPAVQTITFSIVLVNLTGTPTTTCELFNEAGASLGTVALGGSGTTRTLTNAQFGSAHRALVVTTLSGNSDRVTIQRLKDGDTGDSALSGYITNESHVISTDTAGTIPAGALSNAGGLFKVYLGITDTTSGSTFGVQNQIGLTASINSSGAYTINSLSSDSGSAEFTATYNGVTIIKKYTISKSKQGVAGEAAQSALFASVSNENHIFTASVDGVVANYNGSGTIVRVYEGSSELDYDGVGTANGKYKIVLTSTGVTTHGILDLGNHAYVNDVSNMTADNAVVDLSIEGKLSTGVAFVLSKRITYSKSRSGVAGNNATSYQMILSSNVVNRSSAGVNTPSSVTATLYSQSGTAAPALYAGRIRVSVSTNGTTFNAPVYNSPSNQSSYTFNIPSDARMIRFQAYLANGTTSLIDEEITNVVFDGTAGISGLSAVLSNEFHAFPSNNSGSVTSYDNSGTQIRVYEGTTELNYDGSGVANGTWTFSTTVSNIDIGTITDSGTFATVGNHQNMGIGQDTAKIIYNISGKSSSGLPFTIVKEQTFSKSKVGADSTSYWLVSDQSTISKNASGQYVNSSISFSALRALGSGSPSAYSGAIRILATSNGIDWVLQTQNPNTSSLNFTVPANIRGVKVELYLSGSFVNLLDVMTINVVSDGIPGTDGDPGANGTRVGVLTLYRWSVDQPTTFPSGNSTYTWADGSFTLPPTTNSWTLLPGTPSANQRLWAISRRISDQLTTATSTANWSAPFNPYVVGQAGSNGAAGTNTASLSLYRRASTAPAKPTATMTYNFGTGVLSNITESWSQTIPSGADPLWVITAMAISTSTAVDVLSSAWSNQVKIAENGQAGVNGFNSATIFLFRRTTTSAAPAGPNGNLTYNFTTGAVTGSNFNGWSQSMPTTGGQYRWMISMSAASQSSEIVISSGSWTTARLLSMDGTNGVDGVDGINGTKSIELVAYQWSTADVTLKPAGASYNWSTMALTLTAPTNGWSVNVPSNPGIAGIRLWRLSKFIQVPATEATTSGISMSDAVISVISMNGANGLKGDTGTEGPPGPPGVKTAYAVCYQWSNSSTAPTITGNATFTWSNASYGTPSGWSLNPSGGTVGQTLYEAQVPIVETTTSPTTGFNWNISIVRKIGFIASGAQGEQGIQGIQGVSARIAYTISTASSLATPTPTSGFTSFPSGYSGSVTQPAAGTNEKLYQTDGLYNPATNTTTWSTPYIATFRVANLSSLVSTTGALTVDGAITIGSGGYIRQGPFTGWAWPSSPYSPGFYIGPNGILMGNNHPDNPNKSFLQLTSDGNIYASQFSIVNGVATFSGSLSAASGTLRGTVSSTNMTTWSWPASAANGFHLSSSGLRVGNSNIGVTIESNGNFYAPNFSIVNGSATFSGNVTGATVTGGVIRTASSGKRVIINEGNNNEIRFISKDASNNDFISLVLNQVNFSDYGPSLNPVISLTAKNSGNGIVISSESGSALRASATTGTSVIAASVSGIGLYANSISGIAADIEGPTAMVSRGNIKLARNSTFALEDIGLHSITMRTDSNYTAIGIARAGVTRYGMGVDTENRFWIGLQTYSTNSVRDGDPYMAIQHPGHVKFKGHFSCNNADPVAPKSLTGTASTTWSATSRDLLNGVVAALKDCGIINHTP